MPSSSQFKLPTLGLSKAPSSGVAFVLPKLGNLLIGTVSSPSLSSLSDLAKSQLETCVPENSESKSLFIIPKLFPTKPEVISNVKTEPEKILIDLKCALVPETEQMEIELLPKSKVKENVEVFIPQFTDCDNTFASGTRDLMFDDLFERATLKQLKSRYRNCSFKKLSIVGKIIRYKFRKNFTPVRHVDSPKHFIQRFAFDTPSPDDKILAHLSKNKK